MPDVIEIKGTGFINKGAELMLHAAIQELRRRLPDAEIVVTPTGPATPYLKRGAVGLYQKLWYQRLGIQWGRFGTLIPRNVRHLYGIRLDSELDAVLDASGLAYGDQLGVRGMEATARTAKGWRRHGIPYVLLPQTFGPFAFPRTRRTVSSLIDSATLVFARDAESYGHLLKLVGEQPKIRQAPDITVAIKGEVHPRHERLRGRVCIVPNARMIDMVSAGAARRYTLFLDRCAQMLAARGSQPFFLIHEGETDARLAEECNARSGRALEIVREDDPLILKGIIGSCRGMVGSRFHGLLSALSQGVPALAAGWNHKYEMLFKSYGFPEGIMTLEEDDVGVEQKMRCFFVPEVVKSLSERLAAHAESERGALVEMWDSVFGAIR
jgi:polysaccharide pyruvyl transferase WcaK-like protein